MKKKVEKKPNTKKVKPAAPVEKSLWGEADDAIERMMEVIDGDDQAGGSVPRSITVYYYRGIIQTCEERIETIQQEAEDAGESVDE
jgi:hypothetical protein